MTPAKSWLFCRPPPIPPAFSCTTGGCLNQHPRHRRTGNSGLTALLGAERLIFTSSAQGFDPTTFWLLAQRSYPPGYIILYYTLLCCSVVLYFSLLYCTVIYCTVLCRVAQRSKALHLSVRGVAAVPGSNPGCITSGHD